MYLSTLPEWIAWMESIHTTEIDLGLDRVKTVALRLNLLPMAMTVIIVGGTNGKGSTVAGLESVYRTAGYRTGSFTSPYLFQYNEQFCINGQMVTDQELCEAFARVEQVRGEVPLTIFEFGTLAGLSLFKEHNLDVLILEVGLGGRLDAVNIIDATVSVVTSIGIDHVEWLGDTREKIGYEKAGIFRSEHPAVCGDFDPPITLIETAKTLHAPFYQQGRDFVYKESASSWSWKHQTIHYDDLPRNSLATQNMSIVLMVVTLLQNRLPVEVDAIKQGLKNATVPGRIQIIEGPVTEIYDVSHNPAAVLFLKNKLNEKTFNGKTHVVFSMLKDKDIVASLLVIRDVIDSWSVAPLKTKRAASLELLEESFEQAEIKNVEFFTAIEEAYANAKHLAKVGDRVVVFGSFHTLADVIRLRNEMHGRVD